MSHEILSVKLYELDKKIGRLHSLVRFCETADHEEMKDEIRLLRREYEQGRLALRDSMGGWNWQWESYWWRWESLHSCAQAAH